MARIARQLPRLLRLPALAVLLLAVLVNPVFAAVGDLHEAVRGHALHLDHPIDSHEAADDMVIDDDGQTGDPLHALMHGSHACGHLTALHMPFIAFAFLQLPVVMPHSEPALRVSTAQASPIRPPIAG